MLSILLVVVCLLMQCLEASSDEYCESMDDITCSSSNASSLLQQSATRGSQIIVQHEERLQKFEKEEARGTNRTLSFITVRDAFFEANLGNSSLWLERESLPHEWLVLENPDNVGICKLYAEAAERAVNDLQVFLHPDVFLPKDWYQNFMEKLALLETVDPDWGVIGTAGVAIESKGPAVSSSIQSIGLKFHTVGDNLEMQALDEQVLILRKSHSPKFDSALPGFDMYGPDISLSARHAGKKVYLLNIFNMHRGMDKDGSENHKKIYREWQEKLGSPANQERVQISSKWVQKKWCNLDPALLPTHSTSGGPWDVMPCAPGSA